MRECHCSKSLRQMYIDIEAVGAWSVEDEKQPYGSDEWELTWMHDKRSWCKFQQSIGAAFGARFLSMLLDIPSWNREPIWTAVIQPRRTASRSSLLGLPLTLETLPIPRQSSC